MNGAERFFLVLKLKPYFQSYLGLETQENWK